MVVLQINSERILDILWAFLIKQYFIPLMLVGYEVIIANSYPMRTCGITVNFACKQRAMYLYHSLSGLCFEVSRTKRYKRSQNLYL